MSYLSLTTWSLHRSLGPYRMTVWDEGQKQPIEETIEHEGAFTLLQVPALAAQQGIRALDVCHFHFPTTDNDYLADLRQAFLAANVTFYTLLIDYGDISSEDPVRRDADVAYITRWIDVASEVGAERVRIVGGESDPANRAALECAATALSALSDYARSRGVRVITENFRQLTSVPDNCLYLLSACDNQIGLIADFGNFKSPTKYDDLAKILPVAESVHAKAHYDENGIPDAAEFRACLNLLSPAGYDGPITIVYDGPGDEWSGINRVKDIVANYL